MRKFAVSISRNKRKFSHFSRANEMRNGRETILSFSLKTLVTDQLNELMELRGFLNHKQ